LTRNCIWKKVLWICNKSSASIYWEILGMNKHLNEVTKLAICKDKYFFLFQWRSGHLLGGFLTFFCWYFFHWWFFWQSRVKGLIKSQFKSNESQIFQWQMSFIMWQSRLYVFSSYWCWTIPGRKNDLISCHFFTK